MMSVGSTLLAVTSGMLATGFAGAGARAQGPEAEALRPEDCRIREQGNIQKGGTFSFWDRGVLGDWFLATAGEQQALVVTAWGKAIDGEPPIAAVYLIGPDGASREVGHIRVTSTAPATHELGFTTESEFFGLRLRHTNRRVGKGEDKLRHFLVRDIRVKGARRSRAGLSEYAFFGSVPSASVGGSPLIVETQNLRLTVAPEQALWSLVHKPSGNGLDSVRPGIHIADLPVDLGGYTLSREVRENVVHQLGTVSHARLTYRRSGELTVAYDLLLSRSGHELIARLGLVNESGSVLAVGRLAPVVADGLRLGGRARDWTVIGDAKSNGDPYQTVHGGALTELESWWYAAAKDRETGRSVVLGSLTNSKGLGRFLVLPGADDSLRAAAYLDYEGILIPAGARIEGEWILVHFGLRGTDGLERFGDLIALAHDIDLPKQHPLDPYTPEGVSLFNTWNSYGSGVVKGFAYKHDSSDGKKPFMDREWVKANRRKVKELGLQHFGYAPTGPVKVRGVATPLARRYGQPDFWFKAAKAIHDEHPEYYVNGRVDFSNPHVVAFERERVRKSFEGKTGIIRYGLDFTNRWEKLAGQHDPRMTSAETYRTALGLWRDAGRKRSAPAYCFIWMNVVGINYDRVQVIHIGHDSDQGYGGRGLTFTHGLTRQISGRYFYNGRVWWNSPDSYHVYVGGLYSHSQGKVHASYCSLSGNLVHLAEPFVDQEIPEDRLDLIRRVAPTTPDVSRAVDVFEHNPARLWDMPVKRAFGEWHVVGLFNVDYNGRGSAVTEEIRFADLDLSPESEYLVYEFWTKSFLGAMTGSFTRTFAAPDCEVYSIVEKQPHPVLVSTNRHVRQMAYDILDLRWSADSATLSGTSKVVQNDPYELRVFVPEEYEAAGCEAGGLDVGRERQQRLLIVRFTSPTSRDVPWTVRFTRRGR